MSSYKTSGKGSVIIIGVCMLGGLVALALTRLKHSPAPSTAAPAASTSAPAGSEPQTQAPTVSKSNTSPAVTSAPPAKMSDYDLQKEIEQRFEASYKEEMGKEHQAAKEDFFAFIDRNYDLPPEQKQKIRRLEEEMNDELSRAANEAQKDQIIQEYASRLVPILGGARPGEQ